MRPIRAISLLFSLVLLGAPLRVEAAENDGLSDIQQRAKDTFLQGIEAMDLGDYRTALDLLQKSQALYPKPTTLLNVARCEERLGRLRSAWEHFIALLDTLPPNDARRPMILEKLAALGPRLPRVKVLVAGNVRAEVTLMLDGDLIVASSVGGEGLPVDPGPHELRVTAPGRPGRSYDFTIPEGITRTLTVDPGVASNDAHPVPDRKQSERVIVPNLPPPPDKVPVLGRNAGIAFGISGLAGLAIGGVTGVMALVQASRASEVCPTWEECVASGNTGEYTQLAASNKLYGTIGVGSLLFGTLLAGGGAAILSGGGRGAARTTAAARVAVSWTGVVVTGEF